MAAGHKDNKLIIFAVKHISPFSSVTTALYATTPSLETW